MERHLNEEDVQRLTNAYEADYRVIFIYQDFDKEVYNYATEIRNKMDAIGYKNINATRAATMMSGFAPNPRFSLNRDDNRKLVEITIESLPKN